MREVLTLKFMWFLIAVGLTTTVLSQIIPDVAPGRAVWMAVANFGIFLGYAFVAVNVAPYFKVDLGTKVAAIIFFVTCGLTHVELGLHTAIEGFVSREELLDWHMLIIHSVQVASIWRFVVGLRNSAIIEGERLKRYIQEEHPPAEAVVDKVLDEDKRL